MNTEEELKLWVGMMYNNRGMGIAPMYLQRFMQFCEQNNLTSEAGYNVFTYQEENEMQIRLMTEEEKAQAKAQDMLEYWGERCKDFDGGCVACQAWKHFDETGEVVK